jgi:hypothetical protein
MMSESLDENVHALGTKTNHLVGKLQELQDDQEKKFDLVARLLSVCVVTQTSNTGVPEAPTDEV